MSVFRREAPGEDRGEAHLASLITDRGEADMPPRPQLRRPVPAEDWWQPGFGAGHVSSPNPEFDPCGAPPIAAGET